MDFQFEYLKHGKALCGKVFKRFVETFNFHNDFIRNIKGDGDLPSSEGCINFDTTDPSHPVIRLNKNKLSLQGLNLTGGSSGCFEIVSIKNRVVTMANPYFMIGGLMYTGPSSVSVDGSCVIAVNLPADDNLYSFQLTAYGSIPELQASQRARQDRYLIPLYQFDVTEDDEGDKSVSVVCDFRNIPQAVMGEYMS